MRLTTTDIPVTISADEFEKLIRESEQNAIIKRFIDAGYIGTNDLKRILDVKEGEKNNGN